MPAAPVTSFTGIGNGPSAFSLAVAAGVLHIAGTMVVYRRIEFARPGWGRWLGGILTVALGLGLAAAFLLLSLGIALVLLPVVVIAVLIGRWRWRRTVAEARDGALGPVIELDYEVLDRPGDDGDRAHRR